MDKLTYKTVLQHYEHELPKIKWSKFIGNIFHIESTQEAEKYIQEIEKKYADASHACYAYRYQVQMNYDIFWKAIYSSKYNKVHDAGEPVSTAGKPIMNMIDKHELHNVLVVVTRYFGGTLLGVWGLIQAYGECAKQVIQHSKILETEIVKSIQFSYAFDLVPIVRNIANKYNAKIIEEKYDQQVDVKISINTWYFEDFKKELTESSKGQIHI